MIQKTLFYSFMNAIVLLCALATFISCWTKNSSHSVELPLSFDQEELLAKGQPLTSGTQSLNRYHSVLRDFRNLTFEYSPKTRKIDLTLRQGREQVFIKNINTQFLVPLLPYIHEATIDDFDKANLLLAEFARNGVSLSYQDDNTTFGFFNSSEGLFDEAAEFQYSLGAFSPNKKVKPKRFSVINNCLNPCLWELNASDAVGEIYHAWFKLREEDYFRMLKENNAIENPTADLASFIADKKQFTDIPLDLDRLRLFQNEILSSKAKLAETKTLGAYSSQDSRRKVQRGFYKILRDDQTLEVRHFSELQIGDVFSLHSFLPPGVYNAQKRMNIPFQPNWNQVVFSRVRPKTDYGGQHDNYGKYGYLEMELFSSDKSRSIIAGNIPIQLLVLSEDYKIPAFGAGVLNAAEPIERRYLRLQKGTYPHYAYLTEYKNGAQFMRNNHEEGYEQIFLRPFQKEEQLYLRMTIVSYERIVDLLEFEIPLEGELMEAIKKASSEYRPPLHEVYQDSNVL